MRTLGDVDVARLRDALRAAPFTVEAVTDLLGADAHRALLRNETTAARRATTDGSATSTLTRLFSLQVPVDLADAERALPNLVDPLCVAGILERSVAQIRARIDLRPYGDAAGGTMEPGSGWHRSNGIGAMPPRSNPERPDEGPEGHDGHDWWVMCDLTPGLDGGSRRVAADHVLGISEASVSLAQLTVRAGVETALDLGTGCGVQSLHLSQHSRRVVATDVNPRALQMARLTARLAEVEYDVRAGSLFEPVAGERFDLVVTNPPFVVSPGTDERLVYRDSGLPGDEVVRRIVTQAPQHLTPGGWCQVLANWVHRRAEAWEDRLRSWLEPTGCDAWVLQREAADLPTYVEMWLADAGLQGSPDYLRRYDAWLAWFDAQGIEAVGFGWIVLRNTGRDRPLHRIEHWPYDIEQPLGPYVAGWASRIDRYEDRSDDALLATRFHQVDGLVEEAAAAPGDAEPESIVLHQQRGLRRARRVDTVEAGLVGACDGELTAGEILDALGTLLGRDGAELRTTYAPRVRDLVADGYLT